MRMGREDSRTWAIRVEEIERLMDQHNISRSELARRSGISPRQIANILNRKNDPREDSITRIASALGVKWRTLLAGHEGQPEEMVDDEVSRLATTRTVLTVRMKKGISPDEAKRVLTQRLTEHHIQVSDIIQITILRD
jgi:transcriptional regulator with XRE-family HTH domain